MSDVNAAPAPAPVDHNPTITDHNPSSEVPINEAPLSNSNPVGSQAPDKPSSRREAIQKAFDKANDPAKAKAEATTREVPKPAEAKKGHNNPPEDTPQEKLDLKRRPDDQPRDRGRFAPRQTDSSNVESQERTGDVQRSYKQLPEHAPYRDPPGRMAEVAKRDWATTPETVRGDIHRMHSEFSQAYNQYRGAAEAFQTVEPYYRMAQEHGTTLDRALNNYVTMEQKLRQDVVGGLDIIVNNLNLRTADGQKLTLADIAYHILNQSPEQHKILQQQNAQQAAAQQIGSLHQEINGLKSHLQQMYAAQQFNQIRTGIDQYADDGRHPRFDELATLIKREIDLGFDLETAYRRAELLAPATHAAQTGNTSAQTRPTDKSIHGAPEARSNGTSRRTGKPVGRREAIESAIRRANGSL